MRPPAQLANALTLLRVLLIPVFVAEYLVREPVLAGALAVFVLASLTDLADGWVARRFRQQSAFGAFMDPVADKLMVVAALMLICRSLPEVGVVLAALAIILREVYVSALREWMSGLSQRDTVAVGTVGKWKTATQMTAIIALLYGLDRDAAGFLTAGRVLLGVSAALALVSCVQYSAAALRAGRAGASHG